MQNNVLFDRKRDCTGCGACVFVCKQKAIELIVEDGFYKPHIIEDKCVNCGLCKKVCYSHVFKPTIPDFTKAFSGVIKDKTILKKSASGGATTAICNELIKKGYSIIGCGYNIEKKISEHVIIDKLEDIKLIRGSKYFQSHTLNAFSFINGLSGNERIAIFGTPCQIFGFKKFLEIKKYDFNKVILIEIFCHGVTSPIIWQRYLESKKYCDSISNVEFRTKDYGWHIPSNAFILTSGKRYVTRRLGDGFFDFYYSTKFFNDSCYSCQCKNNFSNADLRIGDYWGKRFENDKNGVSCILCFSEKGENLLYETNNYLSFYSTSLNDILSYQSVGKVHLKDETLRARIIESLNKIPVSSFNDLNKIVKKSYSFRYRFFRSIYVTLSNIKNRLWKRK